MHGLQESEIRVIAQTLASYGFRDAKKIAYGTEALVLEVGEGQALRFVIPHKDHIERARAQKSSIYQPVTERVRLPHGFFEVFYKETFETIDAYNTPPDDPRWIPIKKAQAALAADGLIFVDYSSANFLNLKTPVGDRMLVGDPGNDVYTKEMDESFFTLMQPALLADFDPDYRYIDSDGIWLQKKRYPNIITGQSFDSRYPCTGKVVGILSDDQIAQMRAGAHVEVVRADGSLFTPMLDGKPLEGGAKEEFLSRVEGSYRHKRNAKDGSEVEIPLYPLQACKAMGIEVPALSGEYWRKPSFADAVTDGTRPHSRRHAGKLLLERANLPQLGETVFKRR